MIKKTLNINDEEQVIQDLRRLSGRLGSYAYTCKQLAIGYNTGQYASEEEFVRKIADFARDVVSQDTLRELLSGEIGSLTGLLRSMPEFRENPDLEQFCDLLDQGKGQEARPKQLGMAWNVIDSYLREIAK